MRVVDDNHPGLTRFTIAIAATPGTLEAVSRKFWDYRIWYKLEETVKHPDTIPAGDTADIREVVTRLYKCNAHDLAFASGVESVSVIYPKGQVESVRRQLAILPVVDDSSTGIPRKVMTVPTTEGTKVIAVLEQCLDIEVPDTGVHLCLNNPALPSWETHIPPGGPFVNIGPGWTFDTKEMSERIAWEKLFSWVHGKGLSISGDAYPNGPNKPPDYTACINGILYDVEMTSVPNMNQRTIKASNRDVEATIRQVARQPDETIEEVTEELARVLSRKAKANPTGRYLLVVSNWSSFDLESSSIWTDQDTSAFHDVVLIQRGKVFRVGGQKGKCESPLQ